MDTNITLAVIIVFLLVCLIVFVVYKESGWKLVKMDEHRHGHGGHGHREHEERERWRRERERERERDRYR